MESSELGHVLVAVSLTLLHEECEQGEMNGLCVSVLGCHSHPECCGRLDATFFCPLLSSLVLVKGKERENM